MKKKELHFNSLNRVTRSFKESCVHFCIRFLSIFKFCHWTVLNHWREVSLFPGVQQPDRGAKSRDGGGHTLRRIRKWRWRRAATTLAQWIENLILRLRVFFTVEKNDFHFSCMEQDFEVISNYSNFSLSHVGCNPSTSARAQCFSFAVYMDSKINKIFSSRYISIWMQSVVVFYCNSNLSY